MTVEPIAALRDTLLRRIDVHEVVDTRGIYRVPDPHVVKA